MRVTKSQPVGACDSFIILIEARRFRPAIPGMLCEYLYCGVAPYSDSRIILCFEVKVLYGGRGGGALLTGVITLNGKEGGFDF